MGVEKG
jgi:suppressor of G2 allele of SKP1